MEKVAGDLHHRKQAMRASICKAPMVSERRHKASRQAIRLPSSLDSLGGF